MPTYSVSGNIYQGGVASSTGLVGATISWTGAASGSTTSGAAGAWTTPSTLVNGTYYFVVSYSVGGTWDFGDITSGQANQGNLYTAVVSGANITGVNFVGQIPGWIGRDDPSGTYLTGVDAYIGKGSPASGWIPASLIAPPTTGQGYPRGYQQ